jgi:hypothetical protein
MQMVKIGGQGHWAESIICQVHRVCWDDCTNDNRAQEVYSKRDRSCNHSESTLGRSELRY